MEIFTLLETLEDILENSKGLPFTNKTMVDKEELLEIIKEIRIKLPDELKQAKWVKEDSFVPLKTIPKVDELKLLSLEPDKETLAEKERHEKLLEIPGVKISDIFLPAMFYIF